jgi:exopolysaccharide biosynthesis protein
MRPLNLVLRLVLRSSNPDQTRTIRQGLCRVLLVLWLASGFGLQAQPRPASSNKPTDQRKSEFIAPGVEHIQITRGHKSEKDATGPWLINLLRIDLTKARLLMVHALDEAVGLETVSSLAARYGAIAAVNSGYFRTTGTYRGDSVGIQMLNGKLLSEPDNVRAAAGLIEGKERQNLIFGHMKFEGQVITSRRSKHVISGLNRPRGEDELIVFTPEFHRTTLTEADGMEIIVRRGRIVSRRDQKGSSVIPADGYVISAAGSAREWALKNLPAGVRVELKLDLSPTETEMQTEWRRTTSMVGGGPQLIKNGRVEITNAAEKILPSFVSDLHPRTAIAKLKSGQILLVAVDGRQAESIGMSLTMLANLLIEFDAIEAINLDGGGSTAMVIRNKLVNKPSDAGGERHVSDAILVFAR